MIIRYDEHYDDAYWKGQKQYRTVDGKTELYHGPALQWEGFQHVCDALAPLVPGKTLLDIGAGGGDLASRFMKKGYDAYGVDVSKYAIENCVPEMKGRLASGDITEGNALDYLPNWPKTFDVVLATDLWEHIFFEDLDRTFDWVLKKMNQWAFFLIAVCTSEDHKQEFVHTKGDPIPQQFEGVAVSGHVNVRQPNFWTRYFKAKGLRIDWHRCYVFQAQREKIKPWKETPGWDMGSTFIVEKR